MIPFRVPKAPSWPAEVLAVDAARSFRSPAAPPGTTPASVAEGHGELVHQLWPSVLDASADDPAGRVFVSAEGDGNDQTIEVAPAIDSERFARLLELGEGAGPTPDGRAASIRDLGRWVAEAPAGSVVAVVESSLGWTVAYRQTTEGD